MCVMQDLLNALGVGLKVHTISTGVGEVYFHLVPPHQTLKIQRKSQVFQLPYATAVLDMGSGGPVGLHFIFEESIHGNLSPRLSAG
jgi:hypothetical protein